MSDAKDLKKAQKLICKLRDEASEEDRSKAYLLDLTNEVIETALTRTYFLNLNKSARKAVMKLYQNSRGREGSMWNHVLRLIEDYAAGRRS